MRIPLLSFLTLAPIVAARRLGKRSSKDNGSDGAAHEESRRLSSTSFFLHQNAQENGDGMSAQNPFNSMDDAIDALIPGSTLYLMGTITNPSYNPNYSFSDISDDHLWHNENTIKLRNKKGTKTAPITIKPFDSDTVVRGDGGNIIVLADCEYIQIEGLEVEGEVNNIPLETAKALQFVYKNETGDLNYRVDPAEGLTDEEIGKLTLPTLKNIERPSYTSTRGIYVANSYRITISGCHVHHLPGGGIRASYSEYVDILRNEVDNVSRRTYAGTHGVVVTYAMDKRDGNRSGNAKYRARILDNLVHHNYNEIYSWTDGKTFIHAGIDEGKGISLQRNQKFKFNGRILVANNVAYYNGYSGIHSNDGDNIDFFSNTAYMNSYTPAITYNYEKGGSNIGISMSGGTGNTIGNNIAVVDTDVGGAAISVKEGTDVKINTNIVWGVGSQALKHDPDVFAVESNTMEVDPLFVDPDAFNFALLPGSPAIKAGKTRFAPEFDFFGDLRDEVEPTIGAIELSNTGIE